MFGLRLTTRTGFATPCLQNPTRMRTPSLLIRVRFPLPLRKPKFPKIWQNHILENLAGAKGIEPLSAVLETDILPLNYAPVFGRFYACTIT